MREDLKIPVQIRGATLEMTFEDMMDVFAQMEEGFLRMGIKAEDARYVRPNAAVTNCHIHESSTAPACALARMCQRRAMGDT